MWRESCRGIGRRSGLRRRSCRPATSACSGVGSTGAGRSHGRTAHMGLCPSLAYHQNDTPTAAGFAPPLPTPTGFPPMNALLLSLALSPAQPADDWKAAEAAHLKNIKQLTSDFVRAGEGYFSPDGTKIIFQAEEKGTGNPFYQIF